MGTIDELGAGCIGFSAHAQGLPTDRFARSDAPGGRANTAGTFSRDFRSEQNLANVRGLAAIAAGRRIRGNRQVRTRRRHRSVA